MSSDPELASEIQRFEERYADNPDSLVFARLADLYQKAGDARRALAVLRRGLQRHPDYLGAHVVRGRAHRALGQAEEAEEAFRRVLSQDSQNATALRALGELARERGDREAALGWYRRLARLRPEDGEVRRALRSLVDGDRRNGIEPDRVRNGAEEAALEDGPTSDEAQGIRARMEELGFAETEEGEPEEADESELRTETLAALYADQGFYEEAAEMYRELLRERPDDETLRRRLASVRQAAAQGSGGGSAEAPASQGGSREARNGEDRAGGARPTGPRRDAETAPARGRDDAGRSDAGAGRPPGASAEAGPEAPPSEAAFRDWRQAVGALDPPEPTMRQHLRELLRGEAVPGLVNRSLPARVRPGPPAEDR